MNATLHLLVIFYLIDCYIQGLKSINTQHSVLNTVNYYYEILTIIMKHYYTEIVSLNKSVEQIRFN